MRYALERMSRFLRRGGAAGPDAQPPSLEYPLSPTPRLAVLGAVFRGETGVHCLPQWTPQQLIELRPMALAGTWQQLSEAARQLASGELHLPDLLYPLVVITPAGEPPLGERGHLDLWDWFGVPAWEQIRTQDGRLLAAECESRRGFHLAPGVKAEELGGWLAAEVCACGERRQLYRLAAMKALAAAGD